VRSVSINDVAERIHLGFGVTRLDEATGHDLLEAAARHLREAGLEVTTRPTGRAGKGIDARVTVAGPSGEVTFDVQMTSRASAASVALIEPATRDRTLIVAPYVQESVGELMRQLGVQFADGAGNAFLRRNGLFIDVRGRRRSDAPRPNDQGRPLRAFRNKGLRILFVLLVNPRIRSGSYRDIAYASGASIGTVHWVMKELEGTGFVASDGERRLHRQRGLFNRWVSAYTLDLYPRLTLAIFDAQDPKWWAKADEDLRAAHAQWSGEVAAQRTYSLLRPGRALVYASSTPSRLAIDHRFRKADGPGDVEIRQHFWSLHSDPSDIVAPAPLVYADLIASGDPRQLEAAAHLREHDAHLRRLDRS
jgi:hypothetical protein